MDMDSMPVVIMGVGGMGIGGMGAWAWAWAAWAAQAWTKWHGERNDHTRHGQHRHGLGHGQHEHWHEQHGHGWHWALIFCSIDLCNRHFQMESLGMSAHLEMITQMPKGELNDVYDVLRHIKSTQPQTLNMQHPSGYLGSLFGYYW